MKLNLKQALFAIYREPSHNEKERINQLFFCFLQVYNFFFFNLRNTHTHIWGKGDEIREYTHMPTPKQLVSRSKW